MPSGALCKSHGALPAHIPPADVLATVPTPAVIHQCGIVKLANGPAAQLFGFADAASMQGFNIFATMGQDAFAALAAHRAREFSSCSPGTNTSWLQLDLGNRDGQPIALGFTCAKTTHLGEPAVLSFLAEVTPDVALTAGLRHSHDVAVTLADAHGHVVWANPASERLTGYTTAELLGHKPGSLLQVPATDPAEVRRLGRHIRAGSSVVSELLNRHKSGREYRVRLQLMPSYAPSGRLLGFVGLQTDITDEAARQQAQRELAQSQLATFSHEVRTPLNAVLNLLDLLQARVPPHPQTTMLLMHAVEAARSIRELVDSVLDNSRRAHFEQQRDLVPMRTHELMSRLRVVATGYPRAEGVDLVVEAPPGIPALMGRPDLLLRILLNLVSNALKHTRAGSVRVVVERGQPLEDHKWVGLRFSVTDTGIGIAPGDQERILKPFETIAAAQEPNAAHSATASAGRQSVSDLTTPPGAGSTGLGLALCEQMLRSMNSVLRLHSVPGRGSCFSFDWYGERAPLTTDARPSAPQGTLQGLRVMVVDDDPVNLLVAHAQLERLGAWVVTAHDVQAALQELSQRGPDAIDVVLMDLQMPVIGGAEGARRILGMPGFERQSVVGLSGEVAPQAIEHALACGMRDFIEKPFDAQTLLVKLQHYRPAPAPAA